MSKKKFISEPCELFIKYSQDVLRKMTSKEREKLKYLELVEKTSFLYHKKPFDESCRKSSYRYFNEYYYANPNVSDEVKRLKKGCKLKIDDILPLLMYEIRKELLNNSLGETKRISIFPQNDIYNKRQKFVLLIENHPESIENIYDVIAENFGDLIDCMFIGYGGISIFFSSDKDLKHFLSYIKK